MPQHWHDLLRKHLLVPLPDLVPAPYANETRLVFHDPEFHNFSHGDKIVAGSIGIDRQCAGLFCLLNGAKKNHEKAKRYLAAIESSLGALEPELTYRGLHRSYKALSWARELVTRFVALISHYVPGVQLDYLPFPAPIHPSIDFVHWEQPMEDRYAVHALCQMQIHQSVGELLLSSSQWVFTGQSGITLLAEGCQLYGLAGFMQQLANAHVAVMDRWLRPAGAEKDEDVPREVRRQLQIMRDFWDWGGLFETPDMLPHLLSAYHNGSWRPDFVFPAIPSYGDFVDTFTTGKTE